MDGPIQIVHLHKIKSADRYLYHYTRAETAIDYILASGTLRMSPFTAVNDPWEAKHWFAEAVLNPGDDQAAHEFMIQTASPALKGESKLLCFTRDEPQAEIDPAAPNHFDFGTIWYRGFCRPRMWAQYASTRGVNDGICLVFDATLLETALAEHLSESAPAAIFRKGDISYRDRVRYPSPEFTFDYHRIKSLGLKTAISEHLEVHWRSLFFTKATDWRDEREFRFFVANVSTDYITFPFKNALKALVVGPDFAEPQVAHLIELCERSFGFRPSQLFWQNGYPQPYPQIPPPGFKSHVDVSRPRINPSSNDAMKGG
ncbi:MULTISPECIES: DUF2971 domain-containing protein [unclassified Bradyrhizobium]|uniref:DUF2971 domain-containing protein n=1 Tax=Bradyrhizobium sp. USDA 4541 TaxID=2817704 RepID=UPI0020A59D07|nr:DUF2971 domain-containing protein [Bradyrhizobium sp. USDA 4541]MCP1848398.1 hypothetical protein [Bradyrhizobium sp. USDA 4541]